MKILVVDDDPNVLLTSSELIKEEGYEVLTASSGKETLKVVGKDHPDLVLLDVALPDADGTEVCKVRPTGGEIIQVAKNGGLCASESPEGKWLYYSKRVNNIRTTWKVPLNGGEETQVHPGPLSYGYDFVVIQEGIYLTKTDRTLEFFDFASGKS